MDGGGSMFAFFMGDTAYAHCDPMNWGGGGDFTASVGDHFRTLVHLVDYDVSFRSFLPSLPSLADSFFPFTGRRRGPSQLVGVSSNEALLSRRLRRPFEREGEDSSEGVEDGLFGLLSCSGSEASCWHLVFFISFSFLIRKLRGGEDEAREKTKRV